MPVLMPTEIYGSVAGLYVNEDRDSSLESTARERVAATYEGFAGEAHGGLTRLSCSRVKMQYPRGTEIRNSRQISILGQDELDAVAAEMGLNRIAPEWVGANLVLDGIPVLTQVPPSSRLIFEGGVSLVVDMENGPCRYAAERINAHRPGAGLRFVETAAGRRGVTAWVEKTGEIALGETCRLHIPPQRLYAPAMERAAAE